MAGPEIVSRGFVYVDERGALLEELKAAVLGALATPPPGVAFDREAAGARARTAVRQLINQRFRCKPVVLPIILEV